LKIEQQANIQESQIKLDYENQSKKIRDELHKETEKEIEQIKKKFEEKIDYVSADVVMAKIHKEKNEQEMSEIKMKNDELLKRVEEIKSKTASEKQDWAFQQLAQSQRPVFMTEQ